MKIKILGIIALLLVLCMSVCSCDALVGELIGGEPPVSIKQIIKNQAILDGIVRSSALGREIEIEIPEI